MGYYVKKLNSLMKDVKNLLKVLNIYLI